MSGDDLTLTTDESNVPPGPSNVPMPVLGNAPEAATALLALCDVAHATLDGDDGSQALVTVENQTLVILPEGGIAGEILDTTDEEDDLDPDGEEDDEESVVIGEEYVYDDPTLQELMSDRYGTRRAEVDYERTELNGTTTTVGGNEWRVRPDITPSEIGITEGELEFEDYMELGVRSDGALPRNARSNFQVALGRRSSPRNKKKDTRCEGTAMFDIFLTLYPIGWRGALFRLNEAIEKKNREERRSSQKIRTLTQAEYWRFNGMLLLCAVTKTGGIEGLYKNNQDGIVKDIQGAHYMNKKRLKEIKNIWVTQFHAVHEKQTNGWWKMGRLEAGFNANRQITCASSFVKTMDESMSSYRPQKAKTGNLPNISFIKR